MRLKRLLVSELSKDFLNRRCEGEEFAALAAKFHDVLPRAVKYQAVFLSLQHLNGERLTKEVLSDTAWWLAGNVKRLTKRHDKGIRPWHGQTVPEWVPVQIIDARFATGPRRALGHLFDFRILAGTPCPKVIQKFWSLRFCHYISRFVGFSRYGTNERTGEVPYNLYRSPRELVTLRLQVLIEPELAQDEPDFKQTETSPSLLNWNKQQMRYRARRVEKHACPQGVSENLKCFQCPFGYGTCRAGTHRRDYKLATCTKCREEHALFDEHISKERCVDCLEKKVREER